MKTVDDYEAIRRAFYLEGMSIREISRKMRHGRAVIRKAIAQAEPEGYTLSQPREAPVLDPFKARIQKLLDESKEMPRQAALHGSHDLQTAGEGRLQRQ